MKRGFYTIMAAQFFSSLADNALFVTAVELLRTDGAPEWQRAADVVRSERVVKVGLVVILELVQGTGPTAYTAQSLHRNGWHQAVRLRLSTLDVKHRVVGGVGGVVEPLNS